MKGFWKKVNLNGPNGCWLWKGKPTKGGYGRVHLTGGKRMLTHVYSYVEKYGPVPDGLCVLHRCDIRLCVNPDHLWVGTKTDNNQDRDRKGRTAKGIQHGKAKLNLKIVARMKDMYSKGISYRQIARYFEVTHGTVSNAINGVTYRQGVEIFLDGDPVLSVEFTGLPSINTHYNKHYRPRGIETAEWRLEAREKVDALMGWDIGPLVRRALILVNVYPPLEEISDIHNVYIKAVLDGFTDAGVFQDDEWATIPIVIYRWAGSGYHRPKQKRIRRTIIDVFELDLFTYNGIKQKLPKGRKRIGE